MNNIDNKICRIAHRAVNIIPGLRTIALSILSFIWKIWGSRQFKKAYRRALRNGEIIRIHIGAGPINHPGWFNTDIMLLQLSEPLYLNVTKPFPIEDNSVRHIFNEQFIEHISLSDAEFFLKESFRVLDRGGAIRIATPDLEAYSREYIRRTDKARLLLERNRKLGYEYGPACAAIMNKIFYGDYHKYIYDFETLKNMLQQAGFTSVVRCAVRESEDPELRNLEEHDVGSIHDTDFTLVIEARKEAKQNN